MATADPASPVQPAPMHFQEIKHTMKAARLLYTAPQYVLRGPIYLVFIIAFSALVYSFISTKDEIITCQFVVTTEYTKLQAPVGGRAARVHVMEGQEIKLYDPLVDIQYKYTGLDVIEELRRQETELKHQLEWKKTTEAAVQQRDIADKREALKKEQALLKGMDQRLDAELVVLKGRREAARTSFADARTGQQQAEDEVKRLEKSVLAARDLLQSTADRRKKEEELLAQGRSTKQDVDALKDRENLQRQSVVNEESRLGSQKLEVTKAVANVREAERRIGALDDEDRVKTQGRDAERAQHENAINSLNTAILSLEATTNKPIEDMERQMVVLRNRIEEAKTRMLGVVFDEDTARVHSTFAGKVSSAYVKPGSLVAQGEPLFSLIKYGEQPYVRMLIPNKDIGPLRQKGVDMPVTLKYFAYPYQEFGTEIGTISYVAEKPSEIKGEEGMYEVRATLPAEKKVTDLSKPHIARVLGLMGFAEIKTSKKKLIEVVFAPISKFFTPEE